LVRKRIAEGKDTQLIINDKKISGERVQKHLRRTEVSKGAGAIASSEKTVTIVASTPPASNPATTSFPRVSHIFDHFFCLEIAFYAVLELNRVKM
jgi:hypothetical protein